MKYKRKYKSVYACVRRYKKALTDVKAKNKCYAKK